MTQIQTAQKAFLQSDWKSFNRMLGSFTKEDIQQLAAKFKARNATYVMNGSWEEESTVNLINGEGEVVQEDVTIEQGFSGSLSQHFGSASLHFAAAFAVDMSFNSELDEDSFESGSMLLNRSVFAADEVTASMSMRYEERNLDPEIADGFDEDAYDYDYGAGPVALNSASLVVHELRLEFADGGEITIPLQDPSPHLRWFLFAILYMSSGKSLSDLKDFKIEIAQFMGDVFGIRIPAELLK